MNEEARKFNHLSALLSEKDEAVWDEVEKILAARQMKPDAQTSFSDFAGILTHDEALEMKRIIEESCEQINPDDWK